MKNIFITTDVILTNEFFPEAITYIIGKTLQKENQVEQNIVPLSKGAFFLQKQHTFSQLAQHSLTQKERNHIILDVCAFLLFCFFSPLICYQGPKISEKLECTQLNKQTNLKTLFRCP